MPRCGDIPLDFPCKGSIGGGDGRDRLTSVPSMPCARFHSGLVVVQAPDCGASDQEVKRWMLPAVHLAHMATNPRTLKDGPRLQRSWLPQNLPSLNELRREWRRLYRSEPPRISRDLLIRGIGYRLQEIQHGGLGKSTRRKLKTLAKMFRDHGPGRPRSRPQPEAGRPAGARMAWPHSHGHGDGRRIRICRRELSVAHEDRQEDHRRPLVWPALLWPRADWCAPVG